MILIVSFPNNEHVEEVRQAADVGRRSWSTRLRSPSRSGCQRRYRRGAECLSFSLPGGRGSLPLPGRSGLVPAHPALRLPRRPARRDRAAVRLVRGQRSAARRLVLPRLLLDEPADRRRSLAAEDPTAAGGAAARPVHPRDAGDEPAGRRTGVRRAPRRGAGHPQGGSQHRAGAPRDPPAPRRGPRGCSTGPLRAGDLPAVRAGRPGSPGHDRGGRHLRRCDLVGAAVCRGLPTGPRKRHPDAVPVAGSDRGEAPPADEGLRPEVRRDRPPRDARWRPRVPRSESGGRVPVHQPTDGQPIPAAIAAALERHDQAASSRSEASPC